MKGPLPVRVLLWPLLVIASACSAAPEPARFMYVVGCDATVQKLDTYSDRQVQNVDLATRTGSQRVIPPAASPQQYCLSEGALYIRSRQRFFTVVALESDVGPDDGVDYDLLGFSIPELHLVERRTAARHSDQAPKMIAEPGGEVSLGATTDPASAASITLGGTPATGAPLPAQVIQTAGPMALVQIFAKNPAELVLAVARLADHSYVRLRGLPETTPHNAYLVPGGTAVLVEEVQINQGRVSRTSHLALFDSASGERIAGFTDIAAQKGALLAIAPSGKVVYYDGQQYRFVNLGRTFDGDPAVSPTQTHNGRVFFADR